MEFRTKVDIPAAKFKLNYDSVSVFMGSCFADNLGTRLDRLKFPIVRNPFGVLYNPLSVKDNLKLLMDKKLFGERDLSYFNGRWLSFSHYTAFSDTDKQNCLDKINTSIKVASDAFSKARFLFITFGTAWVYELINSGKIVANCHKIPGREFKRYMLDSDQIVSEYSELLEQIHTVNPQLKVIFTLSPIRHWKDGAVGNQFSKATLLVAIHKIKEKFDFVSYFPAYEIFMDELRDYRYYAKDMLHPSETAIDYMWQRFVETYLDDNAIPVMNEVEKIITAVQHKTLNPESEEYFHFRKKMSDLIKKLEVKYPFLNFSEEKNFFFES